MTRYVRFLLAASLLLGATACGGILPAPVPPPHLYHLTPLPAPAKAGPRVGAQLLVEVPAAPAALDTARIALSRSAISVDYFADAAWTDRAPLLIQSLIVESLDNGGQMMAVARQSLSLRADAMLMSDLRHFEAEYQGSGAPVIHIQIDCRLVKEPDRSIIATRSFSATAPASRNDTAAIIEAFDEAFHRAMSEIAPWTAARLASVSR